MTFAIVDANPSYTLALCCEQSWSIVLSCDACGHSEEMIPSELLADFGRRGLGARLGAVAERASCGACGSRQGGLSTRLSDTSRVVFEDLV